MDLICIAPLILQRLCNALLTKHEDVIRTFFETTVAITRLAIEVLLTPTVATCSTISPSTCSSTPSPT